MKIGIERGSRSSRPRVYYEGRCQRTCQESGGNTNVSHRATWISVFAGSDSTMIKDRKFRNRGRIRTACAILPSGGAATCSEDDDKALGESSVGTNAGHGGGLLLHLVVCRTTYARVSRKFDHLATGTLQPARSRSNPRVMWAPALVPPPLIGRHRSQMQLGCCQSHPSNGVSPQRTQRIWERRSTLLKAHQVGSYHLWFHPFSFP